MLRVPYYFGILILSAILAAIYYYAERRNINFGAVIFASAATYLLARAVLGIYVHLGSHTCTASEPDCLAIMPLVPVIVAINLPLILMAVVRAVRTT